MKKPVKPVSLKLLKSVSKRCKPLSKNYQTFFTKTFKNLLANSVNHYQKPIQPTH